MKITVGQLRRMIRETVARAGQYQGLNVDDQFTVAEFKSNFPHEYEKFEEYWGDEPLDDFAVGDGCKFYFGRSSKAPDGYFVWRNEFEHGGSEIVYVPERDVWLFIDNLPSDFFDDDEEDESIS